MTREDLITDAKALVDRVELQADWFPAAPIVIGVRRSGAVSLFLGEDEVYHFNDAGQWRRGYWHGLLLKSENGRLVGMRRERADSATNLVRADLSDQQQADHVQRMQRRLSQLAKSLADEPRSATIVREVSETPGGAIARFLTWFAANAATMSLAATPRVNG